VAPGVSLRRRQSAALAGGDHSASISWYDNSPGNKFNPDPDNLITYGQRTIDEIGGAWVSYYYLSDEEFKQQTEARKAKQQIAKKTD